MYMYDKEKVLCLSLGTKSSLTVKQKFNIVAS